MAAVNLKPNGKTGAGESVALKAARALEVPLLGDLKAKLAPPSSSA